MKFEYSPFVAMQVENYEEAVKFYSEVMGMAVISRGESETELRCGEMSFYIEKSDQKQHFFEFKTDNLEEAVEKLTVNGCKFNETKTPEGTKSYFVRDPHGMVFHLFSESGKS